MTRITKILPTLTAIALLPLFAQAAPLSVTIDGVEARGGTLYIGVQTEAQFMKNEGIEGDFIKAPTAGTHTVTFDLPDGAYGVSVWHDSNDDYVFELSEAGMPLEGWAMVNGAQLKGMPTFATNSVVVNASGASVKETIFYPAP